MSAQSPLLIRADASPDMGTGHVMRCLALALAAKECGMRVRIIARLNVPWVRERLAREDVLVTEVSGQALDRERPEALLAQLASTGEQCGTLAWVALDGYHFGPDCHKAVHGAGYKLLVIDDYAHLPEYHCNILLNQNIDAENLAYFGDVGKSLFGPVNALLRPEFAAARRQAEARELPVTPRRLLLTLGGGDIAVHLRRITPYLAIPELQNCMLRVIAGATQDTILRECLAKCQADIEIVRRVDDMPALLLDTDLCVTAGGSTCWELCCLGVPFLTLAVAENQRNVVCGLLSHNVAPLFTMENLRTMMHSVSARKNARQAGFDLVSGNGALRCLFHVSGSAFFLRAAEEADSEFIWRLAASPEVRAVSGNAEPIAWEEHRDWFQSRLNDTMPFFVPYDHEGKPMGYVRFTQNGAGMSTVSLAVSQELRGRGLGTPLLKAACRKFWKYFPQDSIDAVVLQKNTASLKIFSAAGFEIKGTTMIDNRAFVSFTLQREAAYE